MRKTFHKYLKLHPFLIYVNQQNNQTTERLKKYLTMAAAPEQFEGFMINSTEKWSDFTKEKACQIPPAASFSTES